MHLHRAAFTFRIDREERTDFLLPDGQSRLRGDNAAERLFRRFTGLLFAVRELVINEIFAAEHQKSAAPPYDRMDMNGGRLAFACHPILIYEVRSSLMRIASLRAAPAKSFSSQPSFL